MQAFEQPNIGDALTQVGPKAIEVFAQAKQRADVAQAQDASLQLSQFSSDLLTNPDTGLLNLQGKNALGKGQEYTQQFDSQAEQIAMTLPEGARAGFMQQAQQQLDAAWAARERHRARAARLERRDAERQARRAPPPVADSKPALPSAAAAILARAKARAAGNSAT